MGLINENRKKVKDIESSLRSIVEDAPHGDIFQIRPLQEEYNKKDSEIKALEKQLQQLNIAE